MDRTPVDSTEPAAPPRRRRRRSGWRGRPVETVLLALLAVAVVAAVVLAASGWAGGGAPAAQAPPGAPATTEYEATVRDVLSGGTRESPLHGGAERYQVLSVQIGTADRRGQTVTVESTQLVGGVAHEYRPGDAVVV
jgi:hypothetical protein